MNLERKLPPSMDRSIYSCVGWMNLQDGPLLGGKMARSLQGPEDGLWERAFIKSCRAAF